MHKDQRNLIASLALAGTVIAGIAGATAAVQSTDDAFFKFNTSAVASGAFDKWQPQAAATDAYMKISFS